MDDRDDGSWNAGDVEARNAGDAEAWNALDVEAWNAMDEIERIKVEAAAFRRLRDHLRRRHDVQNIDMMSVAGFCRNCLSDWLREEACARNVRLSRDDARCLIYAMPYDEWKARYQTEATMQQKSAFAALRE